MVLMYSVFEDRKFCCFEENVVILIEKSAYSLIDPQATVLEGEK
jgi:hypothetical protein